MINRLFIDGNDAYLQYGVYVTSGGFNELVAFPPLKSVDSNDWQEEDGEEADLSAPVLNTREIQVKFAFGGLFSRKSRLGNQQRRQCQSATSEMLGQVHGLLPMR